MKSSAPRGASNRTMLAVLVVLLIAAAGLFWRQWMQPPTQPDLDLGRGVVEKFLELVRSGHPGEAWDASTAEFKSIEGRESFIRTASKSPILKEPLAFNSAQQVTVNDQPRAEYLYQSPDAKIVRVLVGYEGSVWKVDRLTL